LHLSIEGLGTTVIDYDSQAVADISENWKLWPVFKPATS